MVAQLALNEANLHDICRRYPIRRLALFGSVLRDDFRRESDVDVLVEWTPGAVVGFRVFDLERELSELLGNRRIDLVNAKYLNPRLRERILGSAKDVYVQG
jgi:predicted nucleotidyltransferase